MANCGKKHFLIVCYHSSLVKAAMNAARGCLFSTVKGGMNILRSYLNCSTIVN